MLNSPLFIPFPSLPACYRILLGDKCRNRRYVSSPYTFYRSHLASPQDKICLLRRSPLLSPRAFFHLLLFTPYPLSLLFLSQTVQPSLPQLSQPALRWQRVLHQPSFCREHLREHKRYRLLCGHRRLLQNLHLWARSTSQMEQQMRPFRFFNNAHCSRRRLRDSARVQPHRGL